ncbi:hypothetical protein NG702_19935 [Pseudarthrobacter sp. MDT3-28]|uniref:hypothetical protein n=1 Tax=Pseudarthrobacter raffinosi TaxID=2953651 RepID=UPI00208EF46D|nr:hypothetical protein [Pseudarthrobacter sp. MDT3-28]MCO4239645.1 hypothetical protein [Pseudarthrobacter sp. MDT3-28]
MVIDAGGRAAVAAAIASVAGLVDLDCLCNRASDDVDVLSIQKVWTQVGAGSNVQRWWLPDWQDGKCCRSAVAGRPS